MQEDRGAACATLVALWRGDDTRALEVTGQFPRDYLRDFYFTGPRAVLSAWAHEHAGHMASAQAEWRTVLQVTERELKSAPDDAASLHWKAWALARLGETGPAAEILRQLEESYPDFNGNLNGLPHVAGGFGGLALALGRKDEALAQIARVKLNPALNIRPLTKTILHLNPVFDPLRSDPRFQALIDAALGPEEKKENKPTSAVAPAVSEKSLVVLPLENLSPDPENAFFTDGMHAEIISTLGQIADLKVVSRNSALAFKGSTAPLAEIAQKLGVANVLTGSVRRAGNTARIQLELRRASDEALLWSLPKGDRELKDVLGLQSEVADQVARVLQARADKGIYAGAQLMTKDPQAYDAYLKAMNLYLTDRSEAASQEVILLMDAALQRDSKFMLAAKLIARTHCRIALTTHDLLVRSSHAIEAKKWAETASGLMPGGGGDAMLAQYYSTVERDFLKALGYGENAIRALPGDLDGHNFAGTALIGLGRTEEALAKFETCLRLDPRSLPNWNNLLRTLASLRRREAFDKTMVEALAAYASSATEVPQWSTYRYALTGELPAKLEGLTPQEQAAWLWRSRRFEEQARVLTEEQRQPQLLDLDRLSGLCALHDALIRVQRPAEAETCARQALALAEKLQSAAEVGPTEKPGWMAIALMRVGRDDEALAAARRYVEATSATNQALMRWDREVVLAELYARLHRPRECVELLAKLLHVGSCGLSVNTRVLSVHTLRVDPIWDNVREDPAFKALLADPKNSAPL
jgi:serine/threonine-protein kinase